MLQYGEKFLSCRASGLLALLFSEHMPPPTAVLCSWLYLSNRLLLWFGVSGENGFIWVSPYILYLGLEHPFVEKPEVWHCWCVLVSAGLSQAGQCWGMLNSSELALSSLGTWLCVKRNKNSLLGTSHSQHLPCLCFSLIHQPELKL